MFYGYVRVFYPPGRGRIVLRSELDWDNDMEPVAVEEDGCRSDFLFGHERPYLSFKPCLRDGDDLYWSQGTNKLAVFSETPQDVYPHFFAGVRGRISEVLRVPSSELGRDLLARIYYPAGHDENSLKRYPVLYMHDGKNLFFPEEAFLGRDWAVNDTLELLNCMNLIDRTLVVGIFAGERMKDYTRPGYEPYGRAVTSDLKPFVDARERSLPGAADTAVMGSSLGGVVSFYLGWQFPQVFGNVACLSSTFGYRDNLLERVLSEAVEPHEDTRIYLDSGWPRDNYEATLTLANALLERGFGPGSQLVHLAFPLAQHDERAWGARVHLPLQLFSGKTRRAHRRRLAPTPSSEDLASRE